LNIVCTFHQNNSGPNNQCITHVWFIVGDTLNWPIYNSISYCITKCKTKKRTIVFDYNEKGTTTTGRILEKSPKRGDVVVFKTPVDNRTDYIKRLIGLPGDKVQIINKDLYLNDVKIEKRKVETSLNINCGDKIIQIDAYEETLSNGKKYLTVYRKDGTMINTDEFIVPKEHYFFLGDNRDCSKDSRFLSSVGYVNFNNLVGKARIIFFSNDKTKGTFLKFWNWNQIVRKDRLFKKIQWS